MTQASGYTVDNNPGAQVRADLNTIIAALVSNAAGGTEPPETHAFMLWADTTANQLKIRNSANTAWLALPLALDQANAAPDGLTVLADLVARELTYLGASGAEWLLDPQPDDSGAKIVLRATEDTTLDNALSLSRSGYLELGRYGIFGVTMALHGDLYLHGTTSRLHMPDGTEASGAGVDQQDQESITTLHSLTNSSSWATIGALSNSWTPRQAGNKLVITATVAAAADVAGFLALRAGGSLIMAPPAAGNRLPCHAKVSNTNMQAHTITVVHTCASTSPVTIDVAGRAVSGGTLYVNRGTKDYDEAQYARGMSILNIMEVAV